MPIHWNEIIIGVMAGIAAMILLWAIINAKEKRSMTNHEWLKSLTLEQFALEVFDPDFWASGCNPKNCPYWREDGTCSHPDGELGCVAASIRWLLSDHDDQDITQR